MAHSAIDDEGDIDNGGYGDTDLDEGWGDSNDCDAGEGGGD